MILNLIEYRQGDGYQQLNGIHAFINGGVNGTGLGNGVGKHGSLPMAHTDFIFPAIGEELGLWATLGSVFCFVVIMVYGMAIAMHAKDIFGRLLAVGLTVYNCGASDGEHWGVHSGAAKHRLAIALYQLWRH